MAEFVYILCAAASSLCAYLLYRGYRSAHTHLLFWSSLCFAGLALNNLLLLVDLYLVPSVDLFMLRTVIALAAMTVLIYGLIWDTR
jgi:hypothetical protein